MSRICCNEFNTMKQPVAKKIAKEMTIHGDTRIDNYYWLNDRENPEVIDYLKDENSYAKEAMKETESFQKELFDEIVGRIKQNDESVPYNFKGFTYSLRYEEGKEYPVYSRKKIDRPEGMVDFLDGNKLAEGYSYFHIGDWEFNNDNSVLAYSTDTVSRRKYNIFFRDVKTGNLLEEVIPNTTGNVVWANDNLTLFYEKKDETLRSYRIYRHKIGSSVEYDVLVYEEKDSTYNVGVYPTKSDKYIVICSESTLTSECRILDSDNPDGEFRLFQPRKEGVEYSVSHQNDRFLVLTNYKAENFRLMECSEDETGIDDWKELLPAREHVLVEEVDTFRDFFVVSERENGLVNFRVFNINESSEYYVKFGENDYYASIGNNPEYNSTILRYTFSSLKTPASVYDYNLITKDQKLMKQQEIVGGYNPDDYITDRLYATARDGVKVPVSVVYKKGTLLDGTSPLLLYGYGSYGYSIESVFRSPRLSLIDRGFVYAIAHIRGGEELGRGWYEDGKMLHKKNTFYDFIDCGEFLINENYTSRDKIFALGGSAGGLLIGAVINFRPDLFKGVIAAVPFVDVVTTMLDEDIPLTTGEYDEWGNPNEKKYYEYMLSYSPYDQVEAKDYPAMLVTTGLHDSQVQYWEPAKWVAKLRDMRTNDNPLLLHTNMDFGHGGASGRFEQHKETAMEYAFLMRLLQQKD